MPYQKMNKLKLKNILRAISPDQTSADLSSFHSEVNRLTEELRKKVEIKTLDDVSIQLEKFKKRMSLEPLLNEVQKIKENLDQRNQELTDQINDRSQELENLLNSGDSDNSLKIEETLSEMEVLGDKLSSLERTRKSDVADIENKLKGIDKVAQRVDTLSRNVELRLGLLEKDEGIQEELDKIRKDFMNRLGKMGGGNMNREIFIGGANPLTKYTDMNFKAGANVTITYANNDTTKKVDVTIAATGGSGSGIVRSINSVSAPTTAGATATTDYTYLVTGTTTITLPTAVGNTNLYTVKNVGTNTVTINTTSSQTIDGSLTITLPVQYTSVDIESDNANWNVT